MGEAIRQGLELLQQRKAEIRANGLQIFRPWVFLITDGAPTDEWQSAAAAVREAEAGKHVAFFSIGVGNANMDILKQISNERAPVRLNGFRFREMFAWLSGSLQRVSQSNPGTEVQLEAPKGWASV